MYQQMVLFLARELDLSLVAPESRALAP